jgi:hypothetical protein
LCGFDALRDGDLPVDAHRGLGRAAGGGKHARAHTSLFGGGVNAKSVIRSRRGCRHTLAGETTPIEWRRPKPNAAMSSGSRLGPSIGPGRPATTSRECA